MEAGDYGWSARVRACTAGVVLAFALWCGTAQASVSTSNITTPADQTALALAEEPFTQTFTVSGTSNGSPGEKVRVGCYYLTTTGTPTEVFLAELTIGSGGSFSGGASLAAISKSGQACTLRAVRPGVSASSSELGKFSGPRVAPGSISFSELEENKTPYDFNLSASTLFGGWHWFSAGSCGPSGFVVAEVQPGVFRRQRPQWGAFCEANISLSAPAGGASLVIDGHNAYTTYTANLIYESEGPKRAPAPGEPFIKEERHSLNSTTGALTQSWGEPLARCKKETGLVKPVPAECEGFESTGVELLRTITTGENDLQATVEDRFVSIDGKAHELKVIYGEEENAKEREGFLKEEPRYRFPGEAGFSGRSPGSVSFGSVAPATVYFETRGGHGEGLENPRSAITLTSIPSRASFTESNIFQVVYEHEQVSPGEPLTLTHVLSQSLTETGVESLVHAYEERQIGPPSVAITGPASGTTVSTQTVQVSGTDSYPFPVSVLVNGVAATVTGGTWTATVPLHEGVNSITATAKNHVGESSTPSTITVTYTPPKEEHKEEHKEPAGGGAGTTTTTTTTGSGGTAGFKATSPPPNAVAALTGTPSGKNGRIAVPVSCAGQSGQKCRITVLVTVRERLRGRTVVGLIAKTSSPSRTLTVASVQVTLAAGQSQVLLVPLNRAGVSLLAHHRAIPAAVHVTLVAEPGSTTAVGRLVTITPAPRAHRHH